MLCPHCGTPNGARALKCVRCGSVLPAPSAASSQKSAASSQKTPVHGAPVRKSPAPRNRVSRSVPELMSSPWSFESPGTAPSISSIKNVGFSEAPTQRPSSAPDQKETLISPSFSKEELLRAGQEAGWQDVARAASSPAQDRFGDPIDPAGYELEGETRLGSLADPMVEQPVRGAPKTPMPPAETMAAPGELAGYRPVSSRREPATPMIAGPEHSASAVVRSLKPSAPSTRAPKPKTKTRARKAPSAPSKVESRRPKNNSRPLRKVQDSLDTDQDLLMVRDPRMEKTANFTAPLDFDNLPPEAQPVMFDENSPKPGFNAQEETAYLPPVEQSSGATQPGRRIQDDSPTLDPDEPMPRFGSSQIRWSVASLVRRGTALFVDGSITFGLVASLMIAGLFGDAVADASLIEPDDLNRLLMRGDLTVPLIVLVFWWLTYATMSHFLAGKTLGKLVTGLELVTKQGIRPSIPRCFLRALLGVFGFAAAGLGYAWIFIDRKSRGLHDVITQTMIVISSSEQRAEPISEDSAPDPGFYHERTL